MVRWILAHYHMILLIGLVLMPLLLTGRRSYRDYGRKNGSQAPRWGQYIAVVTVLYVLAMTLFIGIVLGGKAA